MVTAQEFSIAGSRLHNAIVLVNRMTVEAKASKSGLVTWLKALKPKVVAKTVSDKLLETYNLAWFAVEIKAKLSKRYTDMASYIEEHSIDFDESVKVKAAAHMNGVREREAARSYDNWF